ncbi:hypothetical protein HNQ02_003889 [Flavobacterium sp. 7E]|nr:hypothetical protein [Flavobacterium sp. 7E]
MERKIKGDRTTAVLRDCEICAKFTFIFRKKFYLSRKISVTKFATSQSHETLWAMISENSGGIYADVFFDI